MSTLAVRPDTTSATAAPSVGTPDHAAHRLEAPRAVCGHHQWDDPTSKNTCIRPPHAGRGHVYVDDSGSCDAGELARGLAADEPATRGRR